MQLILFGEVFNLLNTANLVQYGGNIANAAGFRPTRRAVHSDLWLGRPESVSVGNESEFLKRSCSGGSASRSPPKENLVAALLRIGLGQRLTEPPLQHLNPLNLPLVGPILPLLDQARPHRIL